jgi:precorrin-6B methylase 2
VGWLLRIAPGGFDPEHLSSILWDLGTTGIAQVGAQDKAQVGAQGEAQVGAQGEAEVWAQGIAGAEPEVGIEVVAGFATREQAEAAGRELASQRPTPGAPGLRVVGVEPARWEGTAGVTEVALPDRPGRTRPSITIEPGTSFGHGGHPTTELALHLLLEDLRPGQSVLDVGTGSGVLAIAAAVVGAAPVVGIDIAPDAVAIATGNARANGVAGAVTIAEVPIDQAGPLVGVERFDAVVANVLAPVQRSLAAALAAAVADGGSLVVAGHLVDDEPDLRTLHLGALADTAGPGVRAPRVVTERRHEDWSALRLQR